MTFNRSLFSAMIFIAIFQIYQPLWAADALISSTTTPDGRKYEGKTKWAPTFAAQKKKIEECKGDCNVIFIGDSITQNWDKNVWNKYYAQRKALNYGISSDRTQHVLFRLQYEPLKTLKPKVAIILIGTNNTDSSPDEIAAGVQAVIQATKADFPGVKIILLDILPTARKTELMSAANTLISKFSDEQTVFRLNLENEMPKVGDNWRGLWTDRLHLTAEGYTIWAETMEPLVSKLLDDTPIK